MFSIEQKAGATVWLRMNRWLISAIVLAAYSALAADVGEVAGVLDTLASGTTKPFEAIARIRFLDAEPTATKLAFKHLAETESAKERADMLEVLASIATPRALHADLLLASLKDDDLTNRANALRALKRINDGRFASDIEAMLTDRTPLVRTEAARTLGSLGQARSFQPLLTAAKNETDLTVRAELITALGALDQRAQAKKLVVFLNDSSDAIRWAAARALIKLQAKEGLAYAEKLLTATAPETRALGVLLFEDLPAATTRPLLKVTKDPSLRVRVTAARVLAESGDASARKLIEAERAGATGEDKQFVDGQLLRLSKVRSR